MAPLVENVGCHSIVKLANDCYELAGAAKFCRDILYHCSGDQQTPWSSQQRPCRGPDFARCIPNDVEEQQNHADGPSNCADPLTRCFNKRLRRRRAKILTVIDRREIPRWSSQD